jgi:hypothetical protein
MIGYHINNGKLRYNDGREIKVGETLAMLPVREHHWVDGCQVVDMDRPALCHAGMHASPTIVYAALYVDLERGRNVDKVQVFGDIDKDNTKFCGRTRKVLARVKGYFVHVAMAELGIDGHYEDGGNLKGWDRQTNAYIFERALELQELAGEGPDND